MNIVALDIGGTAIKSGYWNGSELTDVREWETDAKKGGPALMEKTEEIIRSYHDYDAIGISTAGQVNTEEGSIYYANENIPNYTGMQIRQILEERFQVPVAVENDVNAAAYGELFFGAAQGYQDFLCLTYGTGVGGAIVVNGQVYQGSTYSGGSFGGIVVHPEDVISGVEFSGCYEKYASTTGLVKAASQIDPSLTDGRSIFARMEEPQVRTVIDHWIDEIVYGLISLVHIFNPSLLVLGGGVMSQEYVIGEVESRLKKYISPGFSEVSVVRAALGNQAGMMGAVYLANQMNKKTK